jgi:pyruvate/2-oxoglutarate dehydrogenase complex dihydrolipoamide dehydrogenase (E3) component
MTAPYDFDLICIGSGPAGQRAAVQAAKLGQRAAVIEKRLGALIMIVGIGLVLIESTPQPGKARSK